MLSHEKVPEKMLSHETVPEKNCWYSKGLINNDGCRVRFRDPLKPDSNPSEKP
jgi:hypothetical protein